MGSQKPTIAINLMHKHIWKVQMADAIGRYEKQEGQGETSIIYCRGRIDQCQRCPMMRLVPFSAILHPVVVEKAVA